MVRLRVLDNVNLCVRVKVDSSSPKLQLQHSQLNKFNTLHDNLLAQWAYAGQLCVSYRINVTSDSNFRLCASLLSVTWHVEVTR